MADIAVSSSRRERRRRRTIFHTPTEVAWDSDALPLNEAGHCVALRTFMNPHATHKEHGNGMDASPTSPWAKQTQVYALFARPEGGYEPTYSIDYHDAGPWSP